MRFKIRDLTVTTGGMIFESKRCSFLRGHAELTCVMLYFVPVAERVNRTEGIADRCFEKHGKAMSSKANRGTNELLSKYVGGGHGQARSRR